MKLDKFFTNSDIAEKCCDIIANTLDISFENDFVIEPSAGSGSFIKPIKRLCRNTLFIDIHPEHSLVQKYDYMKMKKTFFEKLKKNNKIHVIGNPPFGFKGSLAIRFIKHSCDFCDTISFILPLSFAKKSMQNTVPLNFHLLTSYIIPPNAFHNKDQQYDIPCIFQIWEKRNYLRKKEKKPIPNGYKFVKKAEKADFAIRRVGSYTGKILSPENRNANSHYFVKLFVSQNFKKIKDINLPSNDFVTGPRSISKKDIIHRLNKMLV